MWGRHPIRSELPTRRGGSGALAIGGSHCRNHRRENFRGIVRYSALEQEFETGIESNLGFAAKAQRGNGR
jgi:hypothetical protein